ncbi:MAG TPA: glycosyltransferase family 4 protein [Candidatus Binatia bacterium]|nr:glycosyltransferase family 4 protein [Candidatus Binatia bacterium]
MRIGLCYKTLDQKGGTERDLFITAEGLRDRGHEVHLFCANYEVEPPVGTFAHRVPVVRLGRTARLWSFALRAPRVIRKQRCDVMLNFGRMLCQDVVRSGGGSHQLFLRKLGQELGMWRRMWHWTSIYHQSLLAIEKRQFSAGHFRKIVAVSEEVKRELIMAYSVSEDLITVIYNGVDHDRFHPSLREKWLAAIRNRWGIPIEAPLVLFVGSGFRRKGLDRLLTAWGSPGLRGSYLLIVGEDARLGAFRARAEKIAPGRIVFAGRQDHIEKYYGAADLLALPAVQEAFGNVVLEALASGVPVVVSRGVGAAELLRGSLNEGIVNQPENPKEIEEKIVFMIGHCSDPDLKLAARKVGERYSWTHHFQQLEAWLSELC